MTTADDRRFGFGLRKRSFKKTGIGKAVSNEKGEFHFTDLEPGWYEVNAANDHLFGKMEFWIARKNTTKMSLILTENPPCGY